MTTEQLRVRVANVITVAWVISLALDAIPDKYLQFTASPWVHGAMMAVAGYLYTPRIASRNGKETNGAG